MKAQFVYESLNAFERGRDPKEALGIGNPLARFANENGFNIFKNKNDIWILTKEMPSRQEPHSSDSYQGYIHGFSKGGRPTFTVEALRYKVNYPKGWEDSDTPISVRKIYMSGGKETKQSLMGRVFDMAEAARKVEVSYKNELKKIK